MSGKNRSGVDNVRSSVSKNIDSSKKTSKKKSLGGGLDKESRELLKNMESKIEDLRKQAFNEINRLEAMMEKDQLES
jgi:hypothetical protein